MKFIFSLFTSVAFIIVLALFSTNNLKSSNIEVSFVNSFCDGWNDGYQDALKGCLKVDITPICPIPPIGRNTYKDGYGLGYAKALQKCDN